MNGLKDEVILEVKEKTTLTGLFFDTFKEDNEGQIVLAIESVSVTELTESYKKRENISVQERTQDTTVITIESGGSSGSREAVGANSSVEFTFRFNEDEFKKKWEEQLQQINASLKVTTETDVTLEAKYWDQLEQWLLKNYEKHFKNLAVEVAKVRFTMDAYTQQMEFSLNQHLQGLSTYLDRLLQDKINVEISKRINQQINQYFDQTFEQKIRNNVGLIINNLVNKQELNQYIDRYVDRQLDQSFEQKVRNNVALIINNIVNRQELNQHIDRHINQTFEQKVRNNIELIVNNILNKQEFNQHIDQHVDSQVNQTFEQKVRNNINLITQNIVNNNTELNQYVSQQIDNTYEQKLQNNLQLITHNIVNNNEQLNQYIDQRLQQTVINNTEINHEIVNIVSNSTEINNKIENLRNEWNQTFISLATQKADQLINILGDRETFSQLITQKIVNNNTELNQYVSQQIDNTYEQKIQNHLQLITHNIVNNNEQLNQYIDQRLQQTVINNTEINREIVNLISNSTEINNKIETLRNEWNQTFISLATQHVDELINTIGARDTFSQLIIQKIVNNNTELNQYVSQQIDSTYEEKVRNYISVITQNIVNNNEELNQYIDQRLQQNVTNNTEINHEIVNLVSNSTEINQKIENLRNEWNQTFIGLATQHVDQLINTIGGRETFNRLITQKIVNNNTELNQYVSQQIDNTYEQKIQNHLQLITHNIVNNNEELNQYIDQRLQQNVTNNTEINNEIVNLVSNSTEINQKIENLRNEWNQTFIGLATQHVDQLINTIGGRETFNRLITQKIVNNNTELNQYVSQQIDNTYEQKVRNYISVITQNIVNNNEGLNQYIDQRLQQTVINNTGINNQIVNLVVNSAEINNKINNVYRDIDIKIANVRNEWNQSFISLVGQYIDEVINIIGNRETFNIRIANLINIKVDELLNQILRTKNELTVIMNNADRHLYEWTLGELMAIKGCLTDRQALVEQLVSFSTELRTKLDCAPCVDINTITPFKPLSPVQPQQLPGS